MISKQEKALIAVAGKFFAASEKLGLRPFDVGLQVNIWLALQEYETFKHRALETFGWLAGGALALAGSLLLPNHIMQSLAFFISSLCALLPTGIFRMFKWQKEAVLEKLKFIDKVKIYVSKLEEKTKI